MRRIALKTLVVGALVAGVPLAPAAVRAATGTSSCNPTFAAVAAASTTGGFHSFGPVRLADTRSQLVDVGAGCTLAVDVPTAIPMAATSVVLSVTADRSAAAGFLTVHPCGSPRPDVSNVNVRSGTPTANVVVTALDPTREVCIYTSVATDLIVDITGYLGPNGAAFQELALHRSVDTRFAGQRPDGGTGRIGPGVIAIPTASLGVSSDASAVIVNITATQASASGYLTAFPCAENVPDTSNVNFTATEDRANQAVIGLAADGSLCVFASVATHVIVDVSGEFAGSEGLPFAATVGARLVDSRNGAGGWTNPMTAGETRVVDTSNRFLPGTRSVVVNVLATRSSAAGFLAVFPCGSTPTTSSVNFGPGRDVANLVVTSTGVVDGKICVFASVATDVVIDLFGGFVASGGLRSLTFDPGTPPVTPAFQPDIHDYAARCTTGSNSFAVDALGMPGTAVAIDGVGQAQRATRTVAKVENAAVVITVTGSINGSDSYWIRCLPAEFPPLTVDRPGQPSPGWYLLANAFNPPDPYAEYTIILDEHGTPVWYRRMPEGVLGAIDFKRLPTGQVAWIIPTGGAFGLTDSGSYDIHDLDGALVRNVKTTLGPTDHHDLVLLPNGNYLAITYVQRTIGATSCVNGNFPFTPQMTTTVVDGVIEEITPDGTPAGFRVEQQGSREPVGVGRRPVLPWRRRNTRARPGAPQLDRRHAQRRHHRLGPTSRRRFPHRQDGRAHRVEARRHADDPRPGRQDPDVPQRCGLRAPARRAGHGQRRHLAVRQPHDVPVRATHRRHASHRVRHRHHERYRDPRALARARPTAPIPERWGARNGSTTEACSSVGARCSPAFTEVAADGTAQYSVSFPPGHFTYRAVKEPPASFSIDVLRATAGGG